MSTFSKSKLAVMILFWSIMVIADILIICYSLFELFVREYFMGTLLLVYGIIDIYGNWWHVSVGVEQINGRFAAGLPMSEQPADQQDQSVDTSESNDPLDVINTGTADTNDQTSRSESDEQQQLADDYKPRHLESDNQQPANEPESHKRQHRRSRTNSLTQMFGFGHKSAEEEKMALRRRGLGLEPENQSADADDIAAKRPLADAISDPLDRQALDEAELGDEHQSLNSRREAMAARHAESTTAMSDAPAGSTSDHKVGHGYDLNQIPTIRLAATPSPEERRVPGELAPDDWIDDDETDKIIKETLAKHQAAESDDADTDADHTDLSDTAASDSISDRDDHDLAEDDIPADDITDTADKADTSDTSDTSDIDDDDDAIPADFDPDDDQAISKMIAQYDAEQSNKKKSVSSDESNAEAE